MRTAADRLAETAETVPPRVTSETAGVDTAAAASTVVIDANGLPYLDPRLPVATRVRDLLRRMTLEEKVGQMTQAERAAVAGDPTLVTSVNAGVDMREEKSLELDAADRATVERVCGAIARCVVLVVSGRPQVFDTAQVDALVASWLPGSEGAGVADVLFGRRPFTGRLSRSWPRSADQEPLNVGDADYDPLYPFGWGLRTDSARDRLAAARAQLRALSADPALRRAAADLTRALRPAYWSGGQVRDRSAVVGWLTPAAAELARSGRDPFAVGDAVVSVVRDLAQAVVVAGRGPAGAAALHARADVQLLSGRPDLAITSLIRAGALR